MPTPRRTFLDQPRKKKKASKPESVGERVVTILLVGLILLVLLWAMACLIKYGWNDGVRGLVHAVNGQYIDKINLQTAAALVIGIYGVKQSASFSRRD